jgi:beta-lactamase regulating signal transducer with metallopeptidase domain
VTLVAAWVWQGMVIAWATAIALGRMPRLNATTRHAVWWFALVAVLVLPLLQPHAPASASATVAPGMEPSLLPAGVFAVPAVPDWLMACGIAMWLGTVVIGLVRIASGVARVRALKAGSWPLPTARQAQLTMWGSVRRSGRRAELRISDELPGACALGLGRPVILVSRAWVHALSDEDLDQIVIHEHAHLARYDDWLRLLQSAIASVAGLHPAVRFILRKIDVEREAACDDVVVSRTGAARRFAACLVNAATASAMTAGAYEPEIIPGAVRSAPALRVRVTRLLDAGRDRHPRLARVTCLASVVTLMATLTASRWVEPRVIFVEGPTLMSDDTPMNTIPSRTLPRGTVRVAAAPGATRMPSRAPRPASVIANDAAVRSLTRQFAGVPWEPSFAPSVRKPERAMLLVNRPLQDGFAAPSSEIGVVSVSAMRSAEWPSIASEQTKSWIGVADSGTALADGAKRAGLATGIGVRRAGSSVGRFFARAGKTVASSF